MTEPHYGITHTETFLYTLQVHAARLLIWAQSYTLHVLRSYFSSGNPSGPARVTNDTWKIEKRARAKEFCQFKLRSSRQRKNPISLALLPRNNILQFCRRPLLHLALEMTFSDAFLVQK